MTQFTPKFRLTSKASGLTLLAAIGLLAMPLSAQAADQAADKVKISATSNGERITLSVPMHLLETDEGTRKLYTALERRAEKSCKTTIPMRRGNSVPVGQCTKRLMKGFVADLDDDGLAAVHADKS